MFIHSFKFLPVLIFIAAISAQCSGGFSSSPTATDTQSAKPAIETLPAATLPPVEPTKAQVQPSPSMENPAMVEPEPITALDGKSLAIERCSTCHAFSRVESAKKSLDGWTKTVDRMISKGAILNPAEEQAVIQYLSETYP